MKKLRIPLLAATLLVAGASAGLVSCQKTVNQPIYSKLAGDYVGQDKEDPATLYITRIYNSANAPDSLYIYNFANSGATAKFHTDGTNNISFTSTGVDFGGGTFGNVQVTGTLNGSIITLQYTLTGDVAAPDPSIIGNFTGNREYKAPLVQGP